MNTLIFAVLLFVFSGIYFIVGALAAKKTKTESDYFLAGRNLGLIPVTFTLIATQLGGACSWAHRNRHTTLAFLASIIPWALVLDFYYWD